MGLERILPEQVTTLPTAKYVFAAIVALLLVIAAGQWYLLGGLTELYLGVPLWLWLQLVIVAAMLTLAWLATSIWTAANDRERTAVAGNEHTDRDERTEW
jgi:hypothetical protein